MASTSAQSASTGVPDRERDGSWESESDGEESDPGLDSPPPPRCLLLC